MRVTHEERMVSEYIGRLKKVSTYARSLGISPVEVYRRIDGGKLDGTEIDGVRFVVMPKEPAAK